VLREMSTPVQARAVRTGEVDVSFLRLPADANGLTTQVVREESMAVFLPETHPLASLREVPFHALAGEPLIVFPAAPRPSWADFVIKACREAGFEPIICVRPPSALLDSFVSPLFFYRLCRLLLGLFLFLIHSLCHVGFLSWLLLPLAFKYFADRDVWLPA